MLLLAIILVTLALILYSVSVVSDLRSSDFRLWVVILFWLGWVFDFSGTVTMALISEGFSLGAHSIVGLLALFLMLIKAIWSSKVYLKKEKTALYRKYTLAAWIFWVLFFISGIFIR